MKQILLFLILFISAQISAQSKYSFKTGLDTVALKYSIKTKTTFECKIDSNNVDTILKRVEFFNKLGYLVKIVEINPYYKIKKKPFFMGNWAEFDYNEKGYLTNENINWLWNGGTYGSDTIFVKTIENKKCVNNNEMLVSKITDVVSIDNTYSMLDSYYYNEDGDVKLIEHKSLNEANFISREFFIYFSSKLLKESTYEVDGIVYSKTSYTYEFY